jgi:hypothetical protein
MLRNPLVLAFIRFRVKARHHDQRYSLLRFTTT